jgi:hypothetical protein
MNRGCISRSQFGAKDQDMGAYLSAADAIVEEFGCVVIIVHHCGVDGSRPRGHTSLTGAVDAQLAVHHDSANNVIVTVEWMKDGEDGAKIASRLEVVTVGTDEPEPAFLEDRRAGEGEPVANYTPP